MKETPAYYRLSVRPLDGSAEVEIDADAVIDALALSFRAGCILKYLWRAGRKPGEPEARDRAKCAQYAKRWSEEMPEPQPQTFEEYMGDVREAFLRSETEKFHKALRDATE